MVHKWLVRFTGVAFPAISREEIEQLKGGLETQTQVGSLAHPLFYLCLSIGYRGDDLINFPYQRNLSPLSYIFPSFLFFSFVKILARH